MSTLKGTVPWNKGKGKGWTDKRGYRWRYVLVNGKPRQVREHRWIMETHLGRKLEPDEVVHHINGNTSDNRIENLEVMHHGRHTVEHHKGTKQSESQKETTAIQARYRGEIARLTRTNAAMYEALLGCLKVARAQLYDVLVRHEDHDGKVPKGIAEIDAARMEVERLETVLAQAESQQL